MFFTNERTLFSTRAIVPTITMHRKEADTIFCATCRFTRTPVCELGIDLIHIWVVTPRQLKLKPSTTLPTPDDERYPLDDAFESDMMLTPIQRQSIESLATPNDARHRKMVSDFRFYWQHGVIPYIVDSSLDLVVSQRLQKAINEWETHTCIRFRPAIDISPENSQVVFKKRNYGCASTVGRVGGRQYANISMFCGVGSIIHELGHLVGFVHEQSRPDRDDYVSILYQNVKTGSRDQFKKYSRKEVETFGIPYDVGSVMHYGSTAFSKQGNLQTIRTNDRQIQMWIGQRDGLSFLDAKLANRVYNCSENCSSSIKCENGGYIGPNCTCVCPRGLAGDRCQGVLTSSTSWCGGSFYGNSGGEIRSPNFPQDYPDNEECYWLIKGIPGSRIELSMETFQVEADENCGYDFLEIMVYGTDRHGRRYCGDEHTGERMMFGGDTLLLHFKSDNKYGFMGFKIKFSILIG